MRSPSPLASHTASHTLRVPPATMLIAFSLESR